MTRADVVVVGAGPAGLAAAVGARSAGAGRVLVVDRQSEPGGILPQCIHTGFGLHRYGEELSGPEFADRAVAAAVGAGVELRLDTMVLSLDRGRRVELASRAGMERVEAGAVVLTMGARERTRGAVRIPGSRPAGVMTAGLAQRLVNLHGVLPGTRVAILGSGDIGLIMARRLVLEGAEVVGVFELLPDCNGLNRNVVQCLDDFDIPLALSTTVVRIHGRDRVAAIDVAPVDASLTPDLTRARTIRCDTLLLSIGLIPENELSQRLGLRRDPLTGGPVVSSAMETSLDGVFAGGNVVHVHDLVDHACREAERAGRSAAAHVRGTPPPPDNVRLIPGEAVASCVPHTISTDRSHVIHLRVRRRFDGCRLRLGALYERRLRYAFPGETVTITVRPRFLRGLTGDALRIDVLPDEDAAP